MESVQDLAEAYTKKAFTQRTYTLWMNNVGRYKYITLPMGPVQSITSVETLDESDVATAVSTSTYYLTGDKLVFTDTPEIVRDYEGLKITYVAGDRSETPAAMRQGMLKALSTAYENREDFVVGQVVSTLPQDAERFLSTWMTLV